MRLGRAFWKDIISNLSAAGQELLGRRPVGRSDDDIRELCLALLRTKGEASVVTLARRTLDAFARLDAEGRDAFFEFLRTDLGAEPAALEAALDSYRAAPSPETAASLAAAAEPRRQELLRLMNTAPDGTRDILAMRAVLLDALSPATRAQARGR